MNNNQIERIVRETIYQNATKIKDELGEYYMIVDEDIEYIARRVKEKLDEEEE